MLKSDASSKVHNTSHNFTGHHVSVKRVCSQECSASFNEQLSSSFYNDAYLVILEAQITTGLPFKWLPPRWQLFTSRSPSVCIKVNFWAVPSGWQITVFQLIPKQLFSFVFANYTWREAVLSCHYQVVHMRVSKLIPVVNSPLIPSRPSDRMSVDTRVRLCLSLILVWIVLFHSVIWTIYLNLCTSLCVWMCMHVHKPLHIFIHPTICFPLILHEISVFVSVRCPHSIRTSSRKETYRTLN